MSEWSKDAARRFLDTRAARQVHEAQSLLDRKVLNVEAPKMWDELRRLFVKKCEEFGSEPGIGNILSCDRNGAHGLKIHRADNGATLTVIFDAKAHAVTFSGPCVPESRDQIHARVVRGSSETFFTDKSDCRVATEDIVEIALGDLLDIN